MLCKHWSWDGCAIDESCCTDWQDNGVNDTWLMDYRNGGRINRSTTSFRLSGCQDSTVSAYYNGDPPAGDRIQLNANENTLTNVPNNDWLSGVKVESVPSSQPNKIKLNTDGVCPSAVQRFEIGTGPKYRCFYDDGDDAALRSLLAGGTATDHGKVKEEFCKLSKNIFKNPGGGQCLEYDTTKALAKEYCSVGDRIATEALCTSTNLGNFYSEVAEAYCKGAGKTQAWCSCYNVTNNVCDTDSGANGCEKKRQTFDKLVEATPQEFKNSWSGMAGCFGGVCANNKYLPQGYNANCSRPVQVCVQNFDIQGIADSTINATCNQNASTGTQPSAGGGGGSPPSGSPPSGSPPSGSPPSGGINDYIPRSIEELKTDSKKQMAVGGVGGLFLMCCCLLLVVLLSSGGGGGGGGGSYRFRR